MPCSHVVPVAACFLSLHVPVVFLSRGVFRAVCGFLSLCHLLQYCKSSEISFCFSEGRDNVLF